MELLNSPTELRSKILEEAKKIGLTEPCYQKMLDYTIEIFETNGLGTEYYGYHNINHELEVTLGILLIGNNRKNIPKLSDDDLNRLLKSDKQFAKRNLQNRFVELALLEIVEQMFDFKKCPFIYISLYKLTKDNISLYNLI